MKNWKDDLITGGKTLAVVKTQRGMLQDDELWTLFFL